MSAAAFVVRRPRVSSQPFDTLRMIAWRLRPALVPHPDQILVLATPASSAKFPGTREHLYRKIKRG